VVGFCSDLFSFLEGVFSVYFWKFFQFVFESLRVFVIRMYVNIFWGRERERERGTDIFWCSPCTFWGHQISGVFRLFNCFYAIFPFWEFLDFVIFSFSFFWEFSCVFSKKCVFLVISSFYGCGILGCLLFFYFVYFLCRQIYFERERGIDICWCSPYTFFGELDFWCLSFVYSFFAVVSFWEFLDFVIL